MSVTAPAVGSGLAAMAGTVGSWSLAASGSAALESGSSPVRAGSVELASGLAVTDQVAIRAPSAALSEELATAGLRQLGALLPAIERQLSDATPGPESAAAALGHLARAVGDAAHQVAAGLSAAATAGSGPAARLGASDDGLGGGNAKEDLEGQGKAASSLGPARTQPLPFSAGALETGSSARVGGLGTSARANTGGGSESTVDDGAGPSESGRVAGARAQERLDVESADKASPLTTDQLPAWRGLAGQMLGKASIVLEQMSDRLQPAPNHPNTTPGDGKASTALAMIGTDLTWAMLQVAGAQRQVAASATLLVWPEPRRRVAPTRGAPRTALWWGSEGGIGGLAGALGLAGTMLLAGLLGLVVGLWVVGISAIGVGLGVAGSCLWGWRVVIGARGLRVALHRRAYGSGWP